MSDSMAVVGSMSQLGGFKKIHEVGEEYWEIYGVKVLAFGIAGDASAVEYIKDKLREGVTHQTRFDDVKDINFSALIVNENGQGYKWGIGKATSRNQERVDLLPLTPPVAIGSGTPFAMGILAIGKGAQLAVKTACRLDKHSGGDLQIWNYPGKPETPSTRLTPSVPEQMHVEETPSKRTPQQLACDAEQPLVREGAPV